MREYFRARQQLELRMAGGDLTPAGVAARNDALRP
jgi:hypothetical protein